MKHRKWLWMLILLILLGAMLKGVAELEQGKQAEDIRQLEQVLHRTAVACYAVEGAYPPDVAYMRQHYGLSYDENRYVVHYERFASNLMPQITVMERKP